MTASNLPPEQRAEELLAAIVASSEDAIISKTLTGVIMSWNAAAERLLGYSAAEAVGQPVLMLIPQERVHEEEMILSRLRAGQRIEHFETVRRTKEGKHLEVALTISPVRNRQGEIIGASKILRDITERRNSERALRRLAQERDDALSRERSARELAERLSTTKDEFLAVLSHELRTPLNAILGWTQVLRRSPELSPDVAKGLEVIERNGRLQTQLIEDLLDMSRIIAGQMRLDVRVLMPSTFIDAAIEALRPAAQSKGLRLHSVLDPSAGPISGDAGRLQQVVWNLLTNAIKFTPSGGRIEILLERVNSHIEISVADTGVGIAADFLPHVFERFRSADTSIKRQHGGLGLGLAIVKHILDLHGGHVNVKSAGPGQGTTFRVHLPIAVVSHGLAPDRVHPRASDSMAMEINAVDLSGLSILVVEDEADARDLVARVLENAGAEVRRVGGGTDALAAMAANKPSLVVTDIGMPGMDGYELIKKLRGLPPKAGGQVPIIALTAFARSEDRTRSLLAGCQAHLTKPVDSSELVATVVAVTRGAK